MDPSYTTNPGPPAPMISVVIPVFNAMRYLPESLAALAAAIQKWGNAELIVLDNGSTDGGLEWLRRQNIPNCRTFSRPGVTIGALRNEGATLVTGEFLSFLDADCVVPPDYFHRAIAVIDSSGADAAGCYYTLPSHPTKLEIAWDDLHRPSESGFVHMLNAGNFLIRRSVFLASGGFSSTLVTGEDAELGLRLLRQGYSQFQSPEIVAMHIGNPATLGQFFRKELWHGRGMLGTARLQIDKPLLMTLLHLVALSVAAYLLVARFSTITVASSLILIFFAPTLTVLYRTWGRRKRHYLLGILLYQVYYLARICALPLAIADGLA